ncbi:hypothetical protein MTO96_008423 [Rhipicephalus appendiculatus]
MRCAFTSGPCEATGEGNKNGKKAASGRPTTSGRGRTRPPTRRAPSENNRALRKKTGHVAFVTPRNFQTTAVLPTLPSHRGFLSGGVS